jgi:tetratricopeptide (TPR) repeat protein
MVVREGDTGRQIPFGDGNAVHKRPRSHGERAGDSYREAHLVRAGKPGIPSGSDGNAGTYGYMSGVSSQQGEIDTAISLQSHSHDILAGLIASDPKNATLKQFLLQTDFWIGYYYHKKGVPDKALLNYHLALKGYQELTSADPHDVLAKRYLAMCYSSIGQTLAAQRQEKEGISQIRTGIEILEALVAADPGENYHKLNDLAGAYSALAEIYARAAVERGILSSARIANWTEARSFYRKTLHILLQMKEKRSGHVDPAELDRVAREINKADEALKLLKAGPG